jgi:hypothetical protein
MVVGERVDCGRVDAGRSEPRPYKGAANGECGRLKGAHRAERSGWVARLTR